MKINLSFDLDCNQDNFIGYSTWMNNEDINYKQWCGIKDEIEQQLNAISKILGGEANTTYGCEKGAA